MTRAILIALSLLVAVPAYAGGSMAPSVKTVVVNKSNATVTKTVRNPVTKQVNNPVTRKVK